MEKYAKRINKNNKKLRDLLALVLRVKKRTYSRIKKILDSLKKKNHQVSDHADIKKIDNLIEQLEAIIESIKRLNINYEILERSDNSASNPHLKFSFSLEVGFKENYIVICKKLFGKWRVFNIEDKKLLSNDLKKLVLLMCYLEYNHNRQMSDKIKIDYILELLNGKY